MTDRSLTGSADLLGWIFGARSGRRARILAWAWLALLYLGGAALWVVFLHRGRLDFNYQDWYAIAGPRLAFLKDALTHGMLPLHISDASTLGGVTDRYLSIPDAFLAPQAVLLLFMGIGSFVAVNQVLMYTLGYAGLLWFRRRYALSPFAFTALFLLFDFNGHILSHYGIGHVTWGGYFLFPWFAMLIVCLLDGDRSWGWVAKMGLLLLFVWLNGSFHQFVWMILFLALLAAAAWKSALTLLKAIFFSLLLALVRILPPALIAGQLGKAYAFYGGYPSLAALADALVTTRPPSHDSYGPLPTLLWWELSLYVGLIGAAFLIVFGVIRWAQHRGDGAGHRELTLPMLGLALLSVGGLYQAVRFLQIPLLDGERVTSRMISLPFVFLILLATIELQRWLDRRQIGPTFAVAGGFLLLVETHDLWANFSLWRVDLAARAFTQHGFDASVWYAVSRADPPYTQALVWGAAGTLAGLLVLAALVWMERRGVLARFAERSLRAMQDQTPSFGLRLRLILARVLAPEVKETGRKPSSL